MGQYIKKAVSVEAFQLNYFRPFGSINLTNISESLPVWFLDAVSKPSGTEGRIYFHENGCWVILTSQGVVEINSGDYVVRDVNGELYACSPEFFLGNYFSKNKSRFLLFLMNFIRKNYFIIKNLR